MLGARPFVRFTVAPARVSVVGRGLSPVAAFDHANGSAVIDVVALDAPVALEAVVALDAPVALEAVGELRAADAPMSFTDSEVNAKTSAAATWIRRPAPAKRGLSS